MNLPYGVARNMVVVVGYHRDRRGREEEEAFFEPRLANLLFLFAVHMDPLYGARIRRTQSRKDWIALWYFYPPVVPIFNILFLFVL